MREFGPFQWYATDSFSNSASDLKGPLYEAQNMEIIIHPSLIFSIGGIEPK